MISCDTNILFAACNRDAVAHHSARQFLIEHAAAPSFVLCEQVLMETYCLLRNPNASKQALSAQQATDVIEKFRANPTWRIVDVPQDRSLMNRVWSHAARHSFAYRRIFDLRLAETLLHHGVKNFATRNLKDFKDCGFAHVFDPCS